MRVSSWSQSRLQLRCQGSDPPFPGALKAKNAKCDANRAEKLQNAKKSAECEEPASSGTAICMARALQYASGSLEFAGCIKRVAPTGQRMPMTHEDLNAMSDVVLLDDAALGDLARDVGPERLDAVLVAFADELDRREPLLRAALDTGDLAAITRETHSIKGSALTFGARRLGEAARVSNDYGRAGDAGAAIAAARGVLELMPRTCAAVRHLIRNGTENQTP